MQKYVFSKWNACGNTTLFFERELPRALVFRALEAGQLDCEQACFVVPKERRMHMAGGEFCVNATRSFGAYLAWIDQSVCATYTVCVSGWPASVHLTIEKREEGVWDASACLQLPECEIEDKKLGPVVHLPGISHLLLPHDGTWDNKRARELMAEYGLDKKDACGVVWYGKDSRTSVLTIRPLVYVRALDTLYAEGACGSGSLALAIALARTGKESPSPFNIVQPSGGSLKVRLEKCSATVSGEVRLVCTGSWYA